MAFGSARTTSKSGNIVKPIPDVNPFNPQTIIFGKAAIDMKKFLKNGHFIQV